VSAYEQPPDIQAQVRFDQIAAIYRVSREPIHRDTRAREHLLHWMDTALFTSLPGVAAVGVFTLHPLPSSRHRRGLPG